MAATTFVTIEGGLLPVQLLERIGAGDAQLQGTSPESYHVESATELNQAISRAWAALTARWAAFRSSLDVLPESDRGTTLTRERWLLPLFQELGFGRLRGTPAGGLAGRAVSHAWGHVPVHLVSARLKLDSRITGERGAAAASPHGLVQDLLNHEESHLWAFLSNGRELRLLRDHRSLTRHAYIAFDLESIFDGEQFSAFRLLYLLCHQSRVESEKSADCWLEKWFAHARDEGVRAMDRLRDGVEHALTSLGSGFLKHPANRNLLTALKEPLSKQDYYRQLLRLVYRLIFLFVAEDRGVLLDTSAPQEARDRYTRLYASTRLRRLAVRRRGGPHTDGWQALLVVMRGLDRGCPELGLPGLGSFLWGSEPDPAREGGYRSRALPDLEECSLSNEYLFDAIHALCVVQDGPVRRPVDWASVQADELGSVYEALMERLPLMNVASGSFELANMAGNERKSTGSYYTPSSLVDGLLDSALTPVLDDACRKAEPEKAILDLAVVDPACGSGHFLVAAARRLAHRLARIRCGGIEPSPPEVRHALRDVVGRCIYGVDLNPMAVELCKVSLWMEAVEPGRPLSFLDSHIQHGNALLGATPELMAKGIPDGAWVALEGDDKKVATALKKRNKAAAQGQRGLDTLWLNSVERENAAVLRAATELEAAVDASPDDVARKETDWEKLKGSAAFRHQRFVADAWCAAFVWPKQSGALAEAAPTNELWRQLRDGEGQPPSLTVETTQALAVRYDFFHWHLAFPAIHARGGFDVVLGNPPWIRQETLKSVKPLLGTFASFSSTADIYVFFLERAVQIARASGYVALVTPNKWFTADYATSLREFLRDRVRISSLVDFGHSHELFPDADTFPALVVLQPARRVLDGAEFQFLDARGLPHRGLDVTVALRERCILIPHRNLRSNAFLLKDKETSALIDRLMSSRCNVDTAGGTLFGIKTGRNEAFYIDSETRDLLVREHAACALLLWSLLRGRDINRWRTSVSGLWHIVIPSSTDRTWPWSSAANEGEAEALFQKSYPSLHAHLKRFEPQLRNRSDQGRFWWELRSCDYYHVLREPKIIVGDIAWRSEFALDSTGAVVADTAYAIPTDRKWILGCLNSRLMWWLFQHIGQQAKDGARRYRGVLGTLPLPEEVPAALQAQIEHAVSRLQEEGKESKDTLRDERTLDDLVAQAYGLSKEERELIERTLPPRDPIALIEADAALAPVILLRRVEKPQLDEPHRTAVGAKGRGDAAALHRVMLTEFTSLPDGSWERHSKNERADAGAALAAVLKAFAGMTPARKVRLAVILSLEPRLLTPSLEADEAAVWLRLIGEDAEPLPTSVASLVPKADVAWGAVIRQLRGTGRLIEDLQANTWAPGPGIDKIETSGWPDGRARMVVAVLERRDADKFMEQLPADVRRLIDAGAA